MTVDPMSEFRQVHLLRMRGLLDEMNVAFEDLSTRCEHALGTLEMVADAIATTVELGLTVRGRELEVQIRTYLLEAHKDDAPEDKLIYERALATATRQLEQLKD